MGNIDSRKKMLFITRKYPPSVGGMENGMYSMSRKMPDEKLDIDVIALGKSQKHLVWFLPYTVLYILIQARKYDFLFLGDGLICICGKIAKKINPKIKRIIILHGLDISYKNILYQYYLRRNLISASDIYACNSSYTENIAKKWGLKTKDGLCVIPHGIDSDKFTDCKTIDREQFYDKYGINKNDLLVITVGRLVKRKGVEWFIRNVLPKLSNVTYLVIGEGEERTSIENAIRETKVDKNVRLLGKISQDELASCYLNSDIFVMPNIHVEGNTEGFGLVALEASLAGLIVIASDIDGIPDAVKNNKNGFLLESRNSDIYTEKIKEVQENLEQYKKRAIEFQKYTSENFVWENTCKNIKDKLINMR